ncbi:MAG TPA: dihydrofolate reductase [Arenimonas sp.]|nr:dihydrofolate reductase [Arenimonas sp.]
MTTITLIAAMDRNRAIGRGNALPWHLPEDLKRFKALTLGKPMLMGRKTAESLGRALPGRLNLVLTRSGEVPFAGMQAVASLDEALAVVADAPELMVIGGGEIYALALPRAARMHLTHVETDVEGADAWFPAFDPQDWQVEPVLQRSEADHSAPAFCCRDYRRKPLAVKEM